MLTSNSHFLLHQSVGSRVGEDDGGLKSLRLLKVHRRVGEDEDDVTTLHTSGGSAIEADRARVRFAGNDVRLEAFAVVIVQNLDLLMLNQPRSFHQRTVDRNAADVVQIGVRHRHAVNL